MGALHFWDIEKASCAALECQTSQQLDNAIRAVQSERLQEKSASELIGCHPHSELGHRRQHTGHLDTPMHFPMQEHSKKQTTELFRHKGMVLETLEFLIRAQVWVGVIEPDDVSDRNLRMV